MSTSGSGPAAGWYDDPADPTMARYWDGEQWTSRVRSKDEPSPAASYESAPSYSSAPSYTTAMSNAPKPSNYLVPAILTTIFCCLPMGIAAIVKAAQVNGLWNSGRTEEAYKASADAKKFMWIAFGLGIAVTIVVFATGGFEVGDTNGSDF